MLKESIDKILHHLKVERDIFDSIINDDYSLYEKNKCLSFSQVESISKFFHVDFKQLIKGDFDLETIKNRFISPSIAVPSEYLESPGTYMSTLRHVADFLEKKYTSKTRDRYLKHIQISETTLLNSNLLLNANVLKKTENFLTEINLDVHEMNDLSRLANNSMERRKVLPLIRDSNSYYEITEKLCKVSSIYDVNFDYKVEYCNDRFQVIAKSRESIIDSLKRFQICDNYFAYFKAYTIANSSLDVFGESMKLIDIENQITSSGQIQRFIFEDQRLFPY